MPQQSKAQNRNQDLRVHTIHNLVQLGRFPNSRQLAQRLECTPRTIGRDIRHMRDTLNMPIEYDTIAQGFYYTRVVDFIPSVTFNIKEAEILNQVIGQFEEESECARILKALLNKLITVGGLNLKTEAA